ncbi:phage tail sheath subtilisin-like domain-containing protein [Pseudomonadota bacterium]|nr:phage tail sheath subtilisin-like domain-containing protein [Pseudomonadota bacterium]
MAISFNTIPSDVRVPLFYAEMDNSQASYFTQEQKILLIGQKLAAGEADTGEPLLVSRTDDAKQLFGLGSMLARMHESVRFNDSVGEVWCIALDDDSAGVAALGSLEFTGTATASGTASVYFAGQKVKVGVSVGDTASTIAVTAIAAINAVDDLPVIATAGAAGVVALAAKWKGETTNDITVIENYRGNLGGEKTPAGITLTITAMSGGATDPDISAAILAMGDDEYDFVIHPYTTTDNLDVLRTEMDDNTGRWAYSRQIYGHVYSAKRGTLSALQAFGDTRNDQHITIAGFEPSIPTPVWEYAAAYGSRNAVFLKADVARPTQTGVLVNVITPKAGKGFILNERETLLRNGIATSYQAGGVARVERAITTYQKNSFDQNDTSYLDSETMHTSSTVLRRLRQSITSGYPRHKLANDGTQFGAGQAIITPLVARGALISEYQEMERLGIVENADLFAANLIVERNETDPNRLDVLFPADYVNQLRVFAVLNQFRLEY